MQRKSVLQVENLTWFWMISSSFRYFVINGRGLLMDWTAAVTQWIFGNMFFSEFRFHLGTNINTEYFRALKRTVLNISKGVRRGGEALKTWSPRWLCGMEDVWKYGHCLGWGLGEFRGWWCHGVVNSDCICPFLAHDWQFKVAHV